MDRDSPARAVIVVAAVALACSLLVSSAAVVLRPLQERNRLIERYRNIIGLTGLVPATGARLPQAEILAATDSLDARVVDLASGEFAPQFDAASFDERAAASDPALSTPIPPELDTARLGRRARLRVVYLVWRDGALDRLVLPIEGQGMWSMLRGYIALAEDLNTIAGVTFYEQAETAGLGDLVASPQWHAKWPGHELFDERGELRFRVAGGSAAAEGPYAVDGLTGATITSNAVTALVDYWFGPHGYGPLLERLRRDPPAPPPTAQGGA